MRSVGDGCRYLLLRKARNQRDVLWLGQPDHAASPSMLNREQAKRLSPDLPAQLELLERLGGARKDRSRAELPGQSFER